MQPETYKIALNLVLTTNKSSSSDITSGFLTLNNHKSSHPWNCSRTGWMGSEQHDLVEGIPAHFNKVGPDAL